MGQKRTRVTPTKTNMQGHESFLLLVHTTMRILLFEQFLQSCHAAEQLDGEANNTYLLRVDYEFTIFRVGWITSDDEPSRACAIFMKECESYNLGKQGIQNEDFWILEWQG